LNLKQVRFKKKMDSEFSSERIEVVIKGKEQFTAGMIGEVTNNFEITNPDLVICNMNPSTNFKIELSIIKGRGYIPADDNKSRELSTGWIATDSIFTPIKNVKYTIENTRVEQRTDYEKLILEVSTDGTIHPEDAVKQAARIMIQHLMLITDENITFDTGVSEKHDVVDEQTLKLRQILKTPLEDLDLSVRAFNCLKAAKINSLSELVQYEQDELMKFRNFGQKSLSEIEQVLIDRGLGFGMDLSKINLDDL
jgi:DNA-directed RNA polymerase subunit alpha